jgi:hypothetical protein
MSLANKMREIAMRAMIKATEDERARCLWVLDELFKKTQAGLHKKLLSPTQLQLANIRMQITEAITKAARTLIVSGVRPKTSKLQLIGTDLASGESESVQMKTSLGLAPDTSVRASEQTGEAAQAEPKQE